MGFTVPCVKTVGVSFKKRSSLHTVGLLLLLCFLIEGTDTDQGGVALKKTERLVLEADGDSLVMGVSRPEVRRSFLVGNQVCGKHKPQLLVAPQCQDGR